MPYPITHPPIGANTDKLKQSMPRPVIIPTNDVIEEMFRMSQEMQILEFDVNECIRTVLDSLTYAQNYPRSFDSDVMMVYENRSVHLLSVEDVYVFNRMLRLLYDRVYQALCATRLYDTTGRCHHEHFTTDHGNILVWTRPFDQPPLN